MDPAVLARRDVEADLFLVLDHHAVGAGVDPFLVGVLGDVVGAGADVAAAVFLVPLRRRELVHVDVVARQNVLQHRAVLDDLVLDRLLGLGDVGQAFGQFQLVHVGREADGQALALAAEEVGQHAVAVLAAGDLVEQGAGRRVGMVQQFGHHADLTLPAQAVQVAHLAQLIGLLDKFAEITVSEGVLYVVGCHLLLHFHQIRLGVVKGSGQSLKGSPRAPGNCRRRAFPRHPALRGWRSS